MKRFNKKLLVSLGVAASAFVVENTTANASEQYILNNDTKTYNTASSAVTGKVVSSTYKKGKYYVYKKSNGMINISRVPGKPGAWVNPNVTTVPSDKTISKTKNSTTSGKNTSLTGQNAKTNTYIVSNPIKTYNSAASASKKSGATVTYQSGTYHIYKKYNGMLNISKTQGKAGAWINPVDNKSTVIKNTAPVTLSQKPTEIKQKNQGIPTNSKNTDTSKVNKDSVYILNMRTNVYNNSEEASFSKNSKNHYEPGTYYVYKVHKGMLNISRTRGRAGAWINPSKNKEIPTTVVKTNDSNKTVDLKKKIKVGNLTKYSSKVYPWSWNYPDKQALKIVESNGGLYKYYTKKKDLYLTFSNDKEEGYTSKMLDILKNNNVKTVFFLTGNYIRNNAALVRRMEAEGHVIANHTDKHYYAEKETADTIIKDIKNWESTYRKYLGKAPTTNLYRPAAGTFSERILKGAASHGYRLIQWSYAYRDWEVNKYLPLKESKQKLIKHSKQGDIILLHTVNKTNRDLLDSYIKEMKARGYTFKLIH
ncbi:MAG: polysaccharide deacetylase family protein [Gemella sp.]|nr:polysaccharide deacetylase family protein [Gemella sp.]